MTQQLFSPRSGGEAKKILFNQICSIFSSITDDENNAPRFSYDERGRIAKVFLKQNIPLSEIKVLAITIACRAVEDDMQHLTVKQWIGYIINSCKYKKHELEKKQLELEQKFNAYLAGEQVFLTDFEYSQLQFYRN